MTTSAQRFARRLLVAYNVLVGPVLAIGLLAVGNGWLALAAILLGHAVWMTSTLWPQCSWFGEVWTRAEQAGAVGPHAIWLTIDDGPHPEDTPVLLDLLDKHDAKATFFFIGHNVEKYPELVRKVAERGHTIGNHTMNHDQYRFWAYGPKGCRREIEQCRIALANAGAETRYFRAPAGLKNPFLQAAAERAGLAFVCWSSRGLDGVSSDRGRILDRLKATARPGGIVLVHEGRADEDGNRIAPDVLSSLLEWLDEQAIRCALPDITA